MAISLSKSKIESFLGDAVVLRLCGEEDLTCAPIRWSSEGGVARIRDFHDAGEFSLNDGILLSLIDCGEGVVRAEYEGKTYECKVSVRPRRLADDGDAFQYYIGDFHVHTSWDHTVNFPRREKDFPEDAIAATKKDGRLDFTVISDHSDLMSPRDLFRAFWAAEEAACDSLVIFPGSESEAEFVEEDHFGNFQRRCCEFVAINSAEFAHVASMEALEEAFQSCPMPVFGIAHPVVYSTRIGGALCAFDFYTQQLPLWKNTVRMIEIGNGSDRGTTMLFEHMYSVALDCGFKVSPTAPSDTHGPVYGFDAMPGKTVVVSPEKNKEMMLDAILANRVYATESGNTKLFFTVNGFGMGKTLPEATTYRFHVELGDLDPALPTRFVKCEVVSDYGNRVATLTEFDPASFDFTVEDEKARYFFLRITDDQGRKTFSAPVWTGRSFDDYSHRSQLRRLDKRKFRAVDVNGGGHGYLLTSGNPRAAWFPGTPSACAVIDMRKEFSVCGVELYSPYTLLQQARTMPDEGTHLAAEFPSHYRISLSEDGENFRPVAEGFVRVFNIGYVVEFEECTTRYVKIEFLDNAGKNSEWPQHANSNLSVGEVEILTKEA